MCVFVSESEYVSVIVSVCECWICECQSMLIARMWVFVPEMLTCLCVNVIVCDPMNL